MFDLGSDVQDALRNKIGQIVAGDLAPFGGPQTDEILAGRLRAAQLAGVLRHTRGIMVANLCNALILLAAQWSSPAVGGTALWALLVASLVVTLDIRQSRRRGRQAPVTVSGRAIRRTVLYAFLLGSLWAAAPLFFFNHAGHSAQLIIACLAAGMLAGGGFSLGTIPVAAVAFMVPIFIASAVAIARSDDVGYFLVAGLLVVYALVLIRTIFVYAVENAWRLVAQFDAERQLRSDPLTHLPNRTGFNESIEAAFVRLSRKGEPFTLVLLDLDSFKAINDRLGRAAGDELLVQAGTRLKDCARPGDALARLGGDAFALIATGIGDIDKGAGFARRILDMFGRPFHIHGQEVVNTASLGLAMAPADGDSAADLFRSADIALYQAKKARGGSFRFFDVSDHAVSRKRRALEHDLGNALARGEFSLAYQPILSLADNRIVGFEALLRWQHPTRGNVPPSEFIPVAEWTGLIRSIGQWVVEEACRTAVTWPGAPRVAVNFSAVQFREPGIAGRITETIAATGLALDRFEVEVTESALLSDDEATLEILRHLAAQGVHIALDDFGTGYSSLSYLRRLPLQRIKIDRSFIQDLQTNTQSAAIVKSVIGLAHDLGIDTTAEGVETEDQLLLLRGLDCGEAQGYLIGRPVGAAEALALLRA